MKTSPIATFTVVHDLASNQALMRLNGVLVLPVGSEIELTRPKVNAIVRRIRLLAGNESTPPAVCLDVDVPEK